MSEPIVYLNGELLPASAAHISLFDRGFLFGDGLFETMRVYGGRVHLLRRHLERLAEGASALRIDLPGADVLVDAIRSTIEANGAMDIVARLTVSRGVGGMTPTEGSAGRTTIAVHLRPLLHNSYLDHPARLITIRGIFHHSDGAPRLKSLNYLTSVRAGFEVHDAGADEGIVTTAEGTVAEGSLSTIFCIREGVLHTPPLDLGILPGITRGRILEIAAAEGIPTRQERFTRDVLVGCDEVFYTNSVREVVPVGRIDETVIGDGRCGAVTGLLGRRYRDEAANEGL